MSQDPVAAFFDELAKRGHEPLMGRGESVGRFEVVQDGRVDRWLVIIKGGYIAVSRDEAGAPDWVLRAHRDEFERIIRGDETPLAALVRGALSGHFSGGTQSFPLLARLFAGPPQARTPTDGRRPAPEKAT
jgi:putative sterol carrier protein